MDSVFPEYNAVSLVTVCLKDQETLSEHSVTFLKTRILSNTERRNSILHILYALSLVCSQYHSLQINISMHALTHASTHTNTHTHMHISWIHHPFKDGLNMNLVIINTGT